MSERVILHCLGWVSRGGVERRRALLAASFESVPSRHVLICQVAKPPLVNGLRQAGWTVHEIGVARSVFDIAWYRRALLLAKQVQPDLIHGAVSEGNLLASILGVMLRKPKVIIEETSDFRGRKITGDWLFWFMALGSDVVVGVAPEIGALLRKKLGVLAHKVRVVNNGVEPHSNIVAERVAAIRKQCGVRSGDLVLGSVGRLLDSHKRFSDVIKVSARLSSRFPNLRVLIVGDGPDRLSLEELAHGLGMSDRVIFAGYQERPREFLDVMSVFVLASSGEALPLALVEAMHAGVPSVASRVGGNPFVLDYGVAGALFNPTDLDHLEREVVALLESKSLRIEMGRRAKKRALEHFSASRYVEDVHNLWDDVLGTA